MGIVNIHEGKNERCSRCNRKLGYTSRLVYGDFLCEECYERLGGRDYKEALDELNRKVIGKGFPAPQIQTEG